MDLGLKGKRALLTGGSRGIGRATLELLADEGCSLAFCARGSAGVEEAADALRARGAEVTAAAVDVGAADAYRAWLREALSELGGLDILICNATGYAAPGDEGWRTSLEVDMLGVPRAIEVLRPALEASDAGSVVAVASTTAVDIFLPGLESYGAMKAALIQHVKLLARDLGHQGVRCNTVSPGPLEFEGNPWRARRDKGDPLYEEIRSGSPFGRLGGAEEVARAIAFLASPAASWITGSNLVIDGGLSSRVDF